MKGDTLLYIYAVLAALGSGLLTLRSRTQVRFGTFVITFWILGGSIIHEDIFNLPLTQLGGKMQIQQLIFLLLASYLLFLIFTQKHVPGKLFKPPYEKYLYVFVCLFLIVLCYHWYNGILTIKQFRGRAESMVIVLIVYLILKKYADMEMVKALGGALIVVAIITSLVAIAQFFINPNFLRIGALRGAFAGRYRSNGVFSTEYINSYFLTIATMGVLVWVRSKIKRKILIPLFLIGIFLSFHRMSWIVTIITFIIYYVMLKKQKVWKFAIFAGVLFFSLYVAINDLFPIMNEVENSSLYKSRISADTMTDRFGQYRMVLERIDKIFLWGVGSTKSSIYYHGMMSIGMGKEWALGESGGIHNGYLEILFFYGLPLVLIFCVMLISILKVFRRLFYESGLFFLFPLLFAVMYCLMNLTNAFSLIGYFGFIFGMIFGGSAAIACRNNLFPDLSTN